MKKETSDAYALVYKPPGMLVGSAIFRVDSVNSADGEGCVLQQYYYPTYEDRTQMRIMVSSLSLD
jgi:hypothetical protein